MEKSAKHKHEKFKKGTNRKQFEEKEQPFKKKPPKINKYFEEIENLKMNMKR